MVLKLESKIISRKKKKKRKRGREKLNFKVIKLGETNSWIENISTACTIQSFGNLCRNKF